MPGSKSKGSDKQGGDTSVKEKKVKNKLPTDAEVVKRPRGTPRKISVSTPSRGASEPNMFFAEWGFSRGKGLTRTPEKRDSTDQTLARERNMDEESPNSSAREDNNLRTKEDEPQDDDNGSDKEGSHEDNLNSGENPSTLPAQLPQEQNEEVIAVSGAGAADQRAEPSEEKVDMFLKDMRRKQEEKSLSELSKNSREKTEGLETKDEEREGDRERLFQKLLKKVWDKTEKQLEKQRENATNQARSRETR